MRTGLDKTLGGLLWLAVAATCHAAPLPQLGIDPAEVSVSGLSSGGFMAVQMHVAHSATFKRGAGVVAGGPFYCAEGSVFYATGRCMTHSGSIPVSSLVTTTRNWATNGSIDPVGNLAASKVYLFSGTADSTVKQAVMNDLRTYYQSFVPSANLVYRNTVASGHAMITDDFGGSCGATASPYINDCNIDLAGDLLAHLHGPLNARNNGALSGTFVEFDQTAFVSGHGMAPTGWAYVPQACAAAGACKLHVAFHGCHQNTGFVGQQFVRDTGYNRWADTNRMVVLYPQTGSAATNGCWDWWGYDSPDYARKSGPQVAAVKAMVARLASGPGPTPPPSSLPAPVGVGASGATATSMVVAWSGVTGAAGYNVYRDNIKANTSLVTATRYTDNGLVPGTAYAWSVKAVDSHGGESPASAPATGKTTGIAASCTVDTNYAHVAAGRAYVYWGYTFSLGGNESMGLWNIYVTTALKQTSPGYYVIGTCP